MRQRPFLFLISTLLFLAVGCSDKVPESYGVYLKSKSGDLNRLSSQQVLVVGNLFQSISGLNGFRGFQANDIKYFIVYEKDSNPKNIKLAKLEFKESIVTQNMFGGNTNFKINMWIPSKSIDFDISPNESKKDMYKLTPKESISNGFYALHFGGLGSGSTLDAVSGNVAYDFVVGEKDKFLSKEEIIANKIDAKYKKVLIAYMNAYNIGDVEALRNIWV